MVRRRLFLVVGLLAFFLGASQIVPLTSRAAALLPHHLTRVDLLRQREIQALEVQRFLGGWTGQKNSASPQIEQLKKLHSQIAKNAGNDRFARIASKEALAQIYLDQGDEKSAEQYALSALQDQSKLPTASAVLVTLVSRRVNLYIEQGHLSEAKSEYQKVLESQLSDEWRSVAYTRLVDLLEQNGEISEALRVCEIILNDDTLLPDWRAFGFLRFAQIHNRQGDIEVADKAMKQLADQYPFSPWSQSILEKSVPASIEVLPDDIEIATGGEDGVP